MKKRGILINIKFINKKREARMKVKVKFAPEWGVGETDGVDTRCCETTPAWLVKFPDEEGHYFSKADLEIIKGK